MLVAAAVCPHPPLLVRETGDLLAACDAAVSSLVEASDFVMVVGDAPATLAYSSGDSGSLARYGIDLVVPLGPRVCAGQPILPLSLTIGAWLLRRTGWTGDRQGYGVAASASPAEAAGYGREMAALSDRVGLLVMGDGSAGRTPKAPKGYDPRAEAFDASVVAALRDPPSLLSLDADLARELGAAGRASWQTLADSAPLTVTYDAAPYGVGYVVACVSKPHDGADTPPRGPR